MKNLKDYLVGGLVGLGSLIISGCEREPIMLNSTYDINNDGYIDIYVEQPYGFGARKRTIFVSNEINGKIEFLEVEVEKDSELYKKYFKKEK